MIHKVTVTATVRLTVDVDAERKSIEEVAEEGYNIAKKSLADNGWIIMQGVTIVKKPEEKEKTPCRLEDEVAELVEWTKRTPRREQKDEI